MDDNTDQETFEDIRKKIESKIEKIAGLRDNEKNFDSPLPVIQLFIKCGLTKKRQRLEYPMLDMIIEGIV